MDLEYIKSPKFMRRFSAWIIDFFCVLLIFFFLFMVLDGPLRELLGISSIYKEVASEAIKAGVAFEKVENGKTVYEYIAETEQAYIDFFAREDIHSMELKAFYLSIVGVVIELFIPCLIFWFILPMCLKNGQTLGKKVFHIGVISQDGLALKKWQMPVRFFVGIFLLETAFSANFFVPGAGYILSLFIAIFSKKRLALHDCIANTVVVDLENTPIFKNKEEREEIYPQVQVVDKR